MTTVHNVAVSGFAKGTNDLYDAARPSYPAKALQTVASALPKAQGEGLIILEPGSGTGIFSRLLLNPPSSDSAQGSDEYPQIPIKTLIGVEPSEGMRETWQRVLESKVPKEALEGKTIKSVEGAFDDFSKSGVQEGSVDGIIIAQAWHWCPDHDKAFTEIAKYLKPEGVLIFVWNIESNRTGWHKAIRELYQPFDMGTPQYYKGWWRRGFESKAYQDLFEAPEETTSEWGLGMTEDQLVNRLFSKSYLTETYLSGEKRSKFEHDLRDTIRSGDKEWINKEEGVFRYWYNTDVVVMRKKRV